MKKPRKAPAPLGRPRTFDQDEAIDAAVQMFWNRGFEASSVGDLADAMSMRRSSFYNAFGDREQLFAAALERYAGDLPDSVLDRIAPGEAVAPVVIEMFREICRLRACDPEARGCLMVNSVAELVGTNQTLGPPLVRGVEHRIARVSALLRQAVTQGELKEPPDYDAAARNFVAFLAGINLLSKVVRSEDDLWQSCRSFLTGLGFIVPSDPVRETHPSTRARKR